MPASRAHRRFTAFILISAFILAVPLAAQQQVQQQETRIVGDRPPADTRTPEQVKQDQQRARQILEVAEGEARSLEAPMRALSLTQIAAGLALLDRPRAATVLRDAFTASLGIERDPQTKGSLQNQILRALLTLDEAAVAELAPQAEPVAKRTAQSGLISAAARRKDFTRAMELLNAAAADPADFPYGAASDVMMAVPPERAADRLNIYMQALSHYRQEDTGRQANFRGGDSFATLIVRYWPVLPPPAVLEGIHLVLDKAKARSDVPAQVSVASATGSASFNSLYEYALFQVLPALRKLDEREAEKLLKDAQPLQPVMAQYPNGMQSLDPTLRDTPPKPGERSGLSTGVSLGNRGGAPARDPQMQVNSQYAAEVERIVKDAPANPKQSIARAAALPADLGGFHPRATALMQIAQTLWSKEPDAARSALDDLMKSLDPVQPRERVQFLAGATSLYTRLGDSDAARKAIDRGFATASELYEKDKSSDSPNEALKGFWPSTAAWRVFVVLATRLAPDSVNEIITGIKDDEIRVSERIAYASTLAGAPLGGNMMMEKRGDNTNVRSFDIPQ